MRTPQIGIYYESAKSVIHVKAKGLADTVTYGNKRVFPVEFRLLPVEYPGYKMLWCQQGDRLRITAKGLEYVYLVQALARDERSKINMVAVKLISKGGKQSGQEGWLAMEKVLPSVYVDTVRRMGPEEAAQRIANQELAEAGSLF